MPDREKAVKDLEECLSASCRGFRPRLSCPYNDEEWDIMRDALALLKEQETTFICNLLGGEPYEVYCKECRTIVCQLCKGETMNDVKSVFSYCPHCGRSVK